MTSYRLGLLLVLVAVKLLYIVWFYYGGGIGHNIGDTAQYIDADYRDDFGDRAGGIGFAYVVNLIFSNFLVRTVTELGFVFFLVMLAYRIRSDKKATLAVLFFLLPTNILFMTVASKELLVFSALFLMLYYGRIMTAVVLPLLLILKPTFAGALVFSYLHKVNGRLKVFLLFFSFWSVLFSLFLLGGLYRDFFVSYASHFSVGKLTYMEPGLYPFSIFFRSFGGYCCDGNGSAYLLSFSMMAVNSTLILIFIREHGLAKGLLASLLYISIVSVYSVHNLGSAARYQSSLAMAIFVCEVMKWTQKE